MRPNPRWTSEVLVIAMATLFTAAACSAGGGSIDAEDDGATEEAVSTNPRIQAGTYRQASGADGTFSALTVMDADAQNERRYLASLTISSTHTRLLRGRYTTSGTSVRKLTLKQQPALGLEPERDLGGFTYSFDATAGTLHLKNLATGKELDMVRSTEGACDTNAECGLQRLPHASCGGAWECREGTCAFECQSPCEASGGTCMSSDFLAEEPDLCAGHVDTRLSCNGEGFSCCK